MKHELGAVILAAGLSSRMGEFKPLLKVDGMSMIGRVTDMMTRAGATMIAVVTGYRHEDIEEHLKDRNVIFVYNENYAKSQMIDSLLLGLDAIGDKCKRVLISPVDVPVVKDETVRDILAVSGQFVRPLYEGKPGHPVVLETDIIPDIKENSSRGLKLAVEASGVEIRELNVDDAGVVMQSNTAEEYSRILKYQREMTGKPQRLRLGVKLCLWADEPFYNAEAARFLALIASTGSMQSACTSMHMAYSRGWKMINHMEKQFGKKLIVRTAGGNGGGSSYLTEDGKALLEKFDAVQTEILKESRRIFSEYFPEGDVNSL